MHGIRIRPLAVVFLLGLTAPIAREAIAATPRFRAVPVATGLASPIGFTFLPNGNLVYVERFTGWIRFRNPVTDQDRRVYRIPHVQQNGSGGAFGVAVHPAWPDKRVLFAFATRNTPFGLRNQVVRVGLGGGSGPATRVILSAPSSTSSDHHGGRILFGPDGKLYVVIGDDRVAANAQDLSANLRGKILRINLDGSIPAGNPFGTRIWAYGIRNSIGFAFDPFTAKLWLTDNGPECNDEVNLIRKGGNHGWGPSESCPNTNNSGPTPRILPKYTFASPIGITGAAFCHGCGLGPSFPGDLLVADYNAGRIRRFDLNGTRNGFDAGPLLVIDFPAATISMEVAPDGRIYFSNGRGIFRLTRA